MTVNRHAEFISASSLDPETSLSWRQARARDDVIDKS